MDHLKPLTRNVLIAALLALGAAVSADQGSQPDQFSLAPLCDGFAQSAPAFTLAGRGLHWSRMGAPSRTLPAGLVQFQTSHPDWLLSAAGDFVAAHQPVERITRLRNCRTQSETLRSFIGYVPTRMAVSETGRVALHAPGQLLTLWDSPLEALWSNQIEVANIDGEHTVPMSWHADRLWIVTKSELLTISPTTSWNVQQRNDSYRLTRLPLDSTRNPLHGLIYNNLLYLFSDSCADIVSAQHELRFDRALCLSTQVPAGGYVGASADSITVWSASGELLTSAPRLSVFRATITGNTYEVTDGLLLLATAVAVSGGTPTAGIAREPAPWDALVPANMWRSSGAHATWNRTVREAGWENTDAVRARWGRAPIELFPDGKSLQALEQDRTPFSAEQIESMFGNGVLTTSLDGVLFGNGWIPMSSVVGVKNHWQPRQPASDHVEAVNREFGPVLTSDGECIRPLDRSREALVADAIQDGLRVDPLVPGAPALLIQSKGAEVVTCATATSSPIRLLYLTDGKVSEIPNHQVANTRSPFAQEEENNRRLARNRIDTLTRVLVGIDTDKYRPGSADHTGLQRQWLDAFFKQTTKDDSFVVDSSALQVYFLGSPANIATVSFGRNVSLAILESSRSTPRQSLPECNTAPAAKHRSEYEKAISLDAIPIGARRIPKSSYRFAIVENEVPQSYPIFRRENGTPAWVRLDTTTPKEPFTPVPEGENAFAGSGDDLRHGARVSTLVFASGQLPGTLADVELVWIDAKDAAVNEQLLTRLNSDKSIVNVSKDLNPAIWTFAMESNAGRWQTGLLIIAAGMNPDSSSWGSPLSWKATNVVGVGAEGYLAANPEHFNADFIDLVVPGTTVATIDHALTVGCSDGTSFMTTYVSSVAALVTGEIARKRSAWAPIKLRARLLATADWEGRYMGKVRGGRLNAARVFDGFDENVLQMFDAASTYDITWDDAERVKITGTVRAGAGTTGGTCTINWRNILRLERKTPPPLHAPQWFERIVAVCNQGVQTFFNATLHADTLPIFSCAPRTEPREERELAVCGALPVRDIKNFVASMTVDRDEFDAIR